MWKIYSRIRKQVWRWIIRTNEERDLLVKMKP